MNTIRYLTFEVNDVCDMATVHPRCPVSDPERYLFGEKSGPVPDDILLEFWRWARARHGFRGVMLFHMYNEPTLASDRMDRLMSIMRQEDPFQPFQLTTNTQQDVSPLFQILKRSDYRAADAGNSTLDARRLSARGEGKPYAEMPDIGRCARGLGWEVPIDFHGNWGLCCNDWRCEESMGNILSTPWEDLYDRWTDKRVTIRWQDEASYVALPRMCRSCLDVNPGLSQHGGI